MQKKKKKKKKKKIYKGDPEKLPLSFHFDECAVLFLCH